jgi:hypothetical protein
VSRRKDARAAAKGESLEALAALDAVVPVDPAGAVDASEARSFEGDSFEAVDADGDRQPDELGRKEARAERRRKKQLVAPEATASATRRSAAAAAEPRRMRAFRFPALLVIVALLVAAMIFERNLTRTPVPATPAELAHVMPVASPTDALSTTWFCAAGTARGSTNAPDPKSLDARSTVVAEHTVVITNQSDRVQRARVTVYPSEGSPVVKVFDLSARARFDLVVSDVVKAPFASALVETDGGLVAVEHRLDGPLGHAVGPCSSSAATSWYFPSGTTRAGARLIYAVFNPFPDQAVIDFDFQVEDDNGRQVERQTDRLSGIVVKPGQVLPVDITDIIQVRPRLSTHIQVRGNRGRVVVDQLLLIDGEHKDPKQISVGLGATTLMDSWLFPDGEPVTSGVETNVVIYNPGGDTVEADVFVNIDGSTTDAEPFTATVRPGQYLVVPLTKDNRLPLGAGYWMVVHSRRGGPVVVAREQKVTAPAPRPGITSNLGSPLLATQWLVPLGGLPNTESADVVIANPSSTKEVTITVSAVADGSVTPIADYDTVVLAPGARTDVDLNGTTVPGAPPARSLRIDANGPVVASQSFAWKQPDARAALIVFPTRGTLSVPDPADIEPTVVTATTLVNPGDFGTVVPGDLPPGTFPPGTDVAPPGTDVDGNPVTTTIPAAGPDGPVPSDPSVPPDPSITATTIAPSGPGGPSD